MTTSDDLAVWLREQIYTARFFATEALQHWPPDDEIAEQVEPIEVGAFVHRNNPRAVLAQCDAHTRILDEIVPLVDGMDDQIEGEWGSGGLGPHEESELLMKLIALAYQHNEGFREEWR